MGPATPMRRHMCRALRAKPRGARIALRKSRDRYSCCIASHRGAKLCLKGGASVNGMRLCQKSHGFVRSAILPFKPWSQKKGERFLQCGTILILYRKIRYLFCISLFHPVPLSFCLTYQNSDLFQSDT